MNSKILMPVIAIVLVAASFYGGMKFQSTKATAANVFTGQGFQRNGINANGQVRFGRNGIRPVSGEVLNVDSKSMTVKMPDGSSRIVILSDRTEINKAEKASASDIRSGLRVAVFGTENSDGSVTAQSVQINPNFNINGAKQPSPLPAQK